MRVDSLPERSNSSRARKVQPSIIIAVATLAVFAISALIGPVPAFEPLLLLYLVVLYTISELLSVQVSRVQSISPAPALLIHAVISHSLSFSRDVILIGGLLAAVISLVVPRLKSRSGAPRESSLTFLYSMSLHLLALYGTAALFEIKLRFLPIIDANVFSRTAFFLLSFIVIKSLITMAFVSLDMGWIIRYVRENWEILAYDGILTNMVTIISVLGILTVAELILTAYANLIRLVVVLPVFILGALLLRNRHVISRRLSYRVRDLEMLNTLIQSLSANLDVNNLVEAIYREIDIRMDIQGFYIGLYNARKQEVYFPIVYEERGRLQGHSRRMSDGASEYIITHNLPLLFVKDPEEEANARGLKLHYRGKPPLSYLGVPITYEHSVLGVMAVRHYSQHYAFDEEDVRLMQTIASAAGVALQNARQYNLLQRQTRELTSLSQIAGILEEKTGLQDFIEASSATLLDLTQADSISITFIDTTRKTATYHHAIGLEESFKQKHLQGLLDKIDSLSKMSGIQTRSFSMSDTGILPPNSREAYIREAGYTSLIEVLYRIENVELAGSVLALFKKEYEHEAETSQIIEIVGSQIAVAFSNARLLNRVFARNKELESLYEASAGMIQSLNVRNILDTVVLSLYEIARLDCCSIWLSDEAGQQVLPRVLYRQESGRFVSQPVEQISPIPIDMRWADIKTPTQAKALFDSMGEEVPTSFSICEGAEGMFYPLRVEDQVIGLILSSAPASSEGDSGSAYFQVIANQAATAISNARNYERIATSLKKRLEELESLETIMYRITLGQSLQEVADEVVKAAYLNTGAELTELLRFNDEDNTLCLISQLREGSVTKVTGELWNVTEGLVGTALKSGQLVNSPDVKTDSRYRDIFDGILSEMVVPLVLDNRPIGVINLESRITGAFGPENERFITNLARQAAIAFQNLAMIERVSQQADEFRSLRNIAIGMLSSRDLDEMLHLIVEQAITYTNAENIHIYLFDNVADRLDFGASSWRTGEIDRRIPDPEQEDLPYQVAHSGKLMYTADKKEKHILNSTQELPVPREVDQADSIIIGIPLRQGDQVIGVFDIVFDTMSFLSEESLHFLELLAAQAAEAITRVRYEQAVRSTRDHLQSILNSTRDGIAMFDNKARLLTANRRVRELLSIELPEGENISFSRVFRQISQADDAFARTAIDDLLQSLQQNPGQSTHREYRLNTSGTVIEEISNPVIGFNGEQLGWIFIFRDITQQKNLEAYRQDMSNMIVHDLRSPLSGVITGLQLALSDIFVMPENETKHFLVSTLSIASQSAHSLLELIENLLDVNKLESGQMPLLLAPCSLSDIISHARQQLDTIFRVEEISFELQGDEGLSPIIADEAKLERVMINLIDNSLHFTPRHGRIRITLSQNPDGSQEMVISDNGPGISLEMREAVFERFTQDRSRQRVRGGRGSGLGLTFCKLTIEAHGGYIWVGESEIGGTSIHITLPGVAIGARTPPLA